MSVLAEAISVIVPISVLDIDPWVHANIWPDLPGNVHPSKQRRGYSTSPFDLAFVDGNHTPADLLADLEYATATTAGLIVVHDAHELARHPELADHFARMVIIPTTHGLAVQWADPKGDD